MVQGDKVASVIAEPSLILRRQLGLRVDGLGVRVQNDRRKDLLSGGLSGEGEVKGRGNAEQQQ